MGIVGRDNVTIFLKKREGVAQTACRIKEWRVYKTFLWLASPNVLTPPLHLSSFHTCFCVAGHSWKKNSHQILSSSFQCLLASRGTKSISSKKSYYSPSHHFQRSFLAKFFSGWISPRQNQLIPAAHPLSRACQTCLPIASIFSGAKMNFKQILSKLKKIRKKKEIKIRGVSNN